jgi:hypothetical protein
MLASVAVTDDRYHALQIDLDDTIHSASWYDWMGHFERLGVGVGAFASSIETLNSSTCAPSMFGLWPPDPMAVRPSQMRSS